ncbi:hypothetical protein E0198_002407 [Clavispora lusitaniae]|nr:hypothetical protein E0198_002407 [Clavispora lusitaniae]
MRTKISILQQSATKFSEKQKFTITASPTFAQVKNPASQKPEHRNSNCIHTVPPSLHIVMSNQQEVPDDYEVLFDKLDIKHNGEITLQDFKKAIKTLNHPVGDNPELVEKVFQSFDSNKDKVIDFNDFKLYLTTTDDQILRGFNIIDQDHDGKLTKEDFMHYLKKTLNLSPSNNSLDNIFSRIDHNDNGYITYDEFREFLLLMPRLHGSRIKTAFTFIAEELDLSSDGDVTLINQFLSGFGFFLAGGLSGVVSRTCTAPFDRIKVFLIARTDLSSTLYRNRKRNQRGVGCIGRRHRRVEEARKIGSSPSQSVEKEFRAASQNNPISAQPPASGNEGESAMKFGSFEATKRALARIEGVDDTSKLSKVSTYLAAALRRTQSGLSIDIASSIAVL